MASIRNRPSTGKATLWTALNVQAFRYQSCTRSYTPCICLFSKLHTFDFPCGRPISYGCHFSSFFGVYEAVLCACSIRLFCFYWPPESALKICQYISGTPCIQLWFKILSFNFATLLWLSTRT